MSGLKFKPAKLSSPLVQSIEQGIVWGKLDPMEVIGLLLPVIEAAEKLDKEYRKIKVSQQERTRCVYEMQGALETLRKEVGG